MEMSNELVYNETTNYKEYIAGLDSLYKNRRLALAGTIGCAALIVSNITLQTDTNLAMFMTGTVVFPSMIDYLTNTQKRINEKHRIKNRLS